MELTATVMVLIEVMFRVTRPVRRVNCQRGYRGTWATLPTSEWAIADWKSPSPGCYDERSRRKELQCLVESFLVSRPGAGAKTRYVWRERPRPRNQSQETAARARTLRRAQQRFRWPARKPQANQASRRRATTRL